MIGKFSALSRKSSLRSGAPPNHCKSRPLFQALQSLSSPVGVLRILLPPRLVFTLLLATSAAAQDPATVGQWSGQMTWPYKQVHAALLPTGKVIFWPAFADGDNPPLWDPATSSTTAAPHAGANIFCSGHA